MLNRRVIIDTDPGIDDAQAIFFALFCGQLQIDAITTVFGNVPVEIAAQNALRLIEMAGRKEIPVYVGAAEPLIRRRIKYAPDVHGKNGFGDIELPAPNGQVADNYAAAELARRVVEAKDEITVLGLGPLTNVALAMRLEPRFASYVQEIIFMGGIISGFGNVSAVATGNIMNDSEAAKIVFNSGAPVTMVGQDVTRPARVLPERRERLHLTNNAIADFLYNITGYYGKFYEREGIPGFPVHDLLVIQYALRPHLFKTQKLAVDVETYGELTNGMTVGDLRPWSSAKRNVTVCLNVDADQVLNWYEEVIVAACRTELIEPLMMQRNAPASSSGAPGQMMALEAHKEVSLEHANRGEAGKLQQGETRLDARMSKDAPTFSHYTDKIKDAFYIPEGLFIVEVGNHHKDSAVSADVAIAPPGVRTSLHSLKNVDERYWILEGTGVMEVDGVKERVGPSSLVRIPAGSKQRITNDGDTNLKFICIVSDRFVPNEYTHHEDAVVPWSVAATLKEGEKGEASRAERDELFMVSKGNGQVTVGSESIDVSISSLVRVPKGTSYSFDNSGADELELQRFSGQKAQP